MKCMRCTKLLTATPEELVMFDNPDPLSCKTRLWMTREADRIRLMAIAMHAAVGHEE